VVNYQKAIQGMEDKKVQSQPFAQGASGKKLVGFVGEVKQELKRIEWTSKDELKAYTKMVVACMFLFGLSIYMIDLVIRGCLASVNFFIKLLIG